jgi:probable HAF family extracellular repeat protein
MVDLGTLPDGKHAVALGISADGNIIVGHATDAVGHHHAFRWTKAGMVDLGTLGGVNSYANGISADGSIIVGQADKASGSQSHAFRWSQASGMVDLGTLGGRHSAAYGTSVSGNVVVGYAADGLKVPDYYAFRWTKAGIVDLGTLGGAYSIAYGVSADGSVIVGQATGASGGYHAIQWTKGIGMRTINQWLAAYGGDASSIGFTVAVAVSANGNVVVGQLSNSHAFLARITR